MAQVTITVNNRDYQIACDNGEEEHLAYLVQYINHHVDTLRERVGQVGEARLLLMAALELADELSTAYSELDALKGGAPATAPRPAKADEGATSEAVESVAARLERLAARLESA